MERHLSFPLLQKWNNPMLGLWFKGNPYLLTMELLAWPPYKGLERGFKVLTSRNFSSPSTLGEEVRLLRELGDCSGGAGGESPHPVFLAHLSAVKDAKETFQEVVINLAALMWLVSVKGNRHQKSRAILFSHDLNNSFLVPLN